MFVSCHPTVPKNGPDPSKSFFFILQKSPEKHCFFTIFNHFFLPTKFSSDFAHKIPFGIRKIIIQKKGDLPTLTFWGMWQETNIYFFRPYPMWGLNDSLIRYLFLETLIDLYQIDSDYRRL